MKEKILIISYFFPPSSDIGGRRWSKIAKHWLNEGNDVEVIASFNNNDSNGSWDKDIERLLSENRINYTKFHYPLILNSYSKKSFLKQLHYRIALFLVKMRSNGNYYDRSIFWSDYLQNIVEKKITAGFYNIVATGPPFYYLKSIVDLKDRYPKLKIWVDLRDPWSWGKGHGMNIITEKRLNIENQFEKSVFKKADLITVPIKNMLSKIMDNHSNLTNVKIMPHFYDPEDISKVRVEKEKECIDLIYAGTVYEGTVETIVKVVDQLVAISNSGINIKWTFYVSEPNKLSTLFKDKKYDNVIEINATIPSDEVLSKILNSDHYIAVYPEKFKNHLSSKFPELLALNSSIVYIGELGEISDFIVENDIGTRISPSEIEIELRQILLNEKVKTEIDFSNFSLVKIAKKSFSENLI